MGPASRRSRSMMRICFSDSTVHQQVGSARGQMGQLVADAVERQMCDGETIYVLVDTHRKPRPYKSLWTIAPDREFEVFDFALRAGWVADGIYWGLNIRNGQAHELGQTAPPHNESALVARTKDCGKRIHGYPADPRRNSQDRPPESVTSKWLQSSLMRKRTIKQLASGEISG